VKLEKQSDVRKVLGDKEKQRVVTWLHQGKEMTATFDWKEDKILKTN
jgi:hypothetical protein